MNAASEFACMPARIFLQSSLFIAKTCTDTVLTEVGLLIRGPTIRGNGGGTPMRAATSLVVAVYRSLSTSTTGPATRLRDASLLSPGRRVRCEQIGAAADAGRAAERIEVGHRRVGRQRRRRLRCEGALVEDALALAKVARR